jgi:predicted ATPase
MPALKQISVAGFKSFREVKDFELRALNVLIGANGAGKSNFISLFRLLAQLLEGRLQVYVQEQDGPDRMLFGGRKRTERMTADFRFGNNGYRITLVPAGERLVFEREETLFFGDYANKSHLLGTGHAEALLISVHDDTFAPYVRPAIRNWRVYHFHDTSASAGVRHAQPVRENLRLKEDASNLAPFLRLLFEAHSDHYRRIVETIRQAVPFFGEFVYRKDPGERLELEWIQQGDPDTVYGPRQLSDGTLRFICLAALLLQPQEFQPDTILLDEPELGLHPYALNLLGALLQQASEQKQLIVSTQSVELVNSLSPEDIVVVNREEGASTLQRLDAEALADWLKDYAVGELWRMNVLGGTPDK